MDWLKPRGLLLQGQSNDVRTMLGDPSFEVRMDVEGRKYYWTRGRMSHEWSLVFSDPEGEEDRPRGHAWAKNHLRTLRWFADEVDQYRKRRQRHYARNAAVRRDHDRRAADIERELHKDLGNAVMQRTAVSVPGVPRQ